MAIEISSPVPGSLLVVQNGRSKYFCNCRNLVIKGDNPTKNSTIIFGNVQGQKFNEYLLSNIDSIGGVSFSGTLNQALAAISALISTTSVPVFPSDIPGLITDYDFTNPANVVTSGGKITQITDAKSGSVATQGNTARQVPYEQPGSGLSYGNYDQINDTYLSSNQVLQSGTDFTIVGFGQMAANTISSGATQPASFLYNGAFSGGNTGYGLCHQTGGQSGRNSGLFFGGIVTTNALQYFAPLGQDEVIVGSHSSGSTKFYDANGDSLALTNSTANPITPSGGHFVGENVAGFQAFNGRMYRTLMYNRQLTDAEVKRLVDYFKPKKPNLVVFGGDSKMTDTGGAPNTPVQSLWGTMPDNYYYMRNTAVPGRGTVALISGLPTEVQPLYKSGVKNVYAMMIGHNDMSGGSSAATIYANILIIVNTVKVYGFKVIVCTDLPSTIDSGWPGVKAAYNASILAGASANDYVAVNTAAIPQLIDPTNTTYYADGTHPTAAAATLMAALISPAIVSI